jgi:hypothetical protein
MIIFSIAKLEIGKVYGPETNETFRLHVNNQRIEEFRFMVMRESNRDEYFEYYKEVYGKYPTTEPFSDLFYEISVD